LEEVGGGRGGGGGEGEEEVVGEFLVRFA